MVSLGFPASMCVKQCQKCSVLKVCGIDKIFYNLFGYRSFDQLIPDAPELILNYLEGEQDASCKRNAFMMLTHVDRVSMSIYDMICMYVCVRAGMGVHVVMWIHYSFLGTGSGLLVHLH